MKKLLLLAACALSVFTIKISANENGCTQYSQPCRDDQGNKGQCFGIPYLRCYSFPH